jgi:tetratricopeptide (TPR) repeat protein
MKRPRLVVSVEPDGLPISRRRFLIIVALGVTTALLTSSPGFLNVQPGWIGIVALAVITVAAAVASTVAVGRLRPAGVPVDLRARQTRALLARSARVIPQQRQAPILSEFRGRSAELTHWTNEHTRLRAMRTDRRLLSPVVLAMHGPPGVGKSALSQSLARKLADNYPDGYFVASFGASGTARGPPDIARDLLLQLGWPEQDMPNETEDRVATLRSLTRGKRMLFLFDAARDHDQVRHVMPAEPGCAVIVSSRRELASSLGLPARPPIGSTSLADSLEIFGAISGIDWTRDAETAVEIVELCGHLPLAIRSVAERIRDGESLRYVAALLRPAESRLVALDYGGRSIRERIKSEFDRLAPRQRRALALLSTMDSDTFVPWVLRPLMNLEQHESTTLAAGLAAAQFIDEIGKDGTGQARYRIHPLMRLYALQELSDLEVEDVVAAKGRFNEAYVELMDEVLSYRDDSYPIIRTERRVWRSVHSRIAERIVPALDQIVPYEYLNLVRIIHAADPETHARMIWRLAAFVDSRTPAFPQWSRSVSQWMKHIESTLERGIAAARSCRTIVGEAEVCLAHAQFLIAVERYDAAFTVLATTSDLLDAAVVDDSSAIGRLRLRLVRVKAWAYIQLGAYRDAHELLSDAEDLIRRLPRETVDEPYVRTDIALISLYNDEAHRVAQGRRRPEFRRAKAASNEIVEFRKDLGRIEELRRKGNWDDALADLRKLVNRAVDTRSQTTARYRLARLLVDLSRHLPDTPDKLARRSRAIREAILQAAACVVAFKSIGDDVGQIRARCLLMRTLLMAGNLVAAMQLSLEIEAELAAEEEISSVHVQPLRGRFDRARAEVEIADGRRPSAWASLTSAAQIFRELQDWSSHADTWRVLDELYNGGKGLVADEPKHR